MGGALKDEFAFSHKTYFDIINEIGSHALMADMTTGIFKDSHAKTMEKYIGVATKLHDNMLYKWDYNCAEEITLKQIRTEVYRAYRSEVLDDFVRVSKESVEYYSPLPEQRKAQAVVLKIWLSGNKL